MPKSSRCPRCDVHVKPENLPDHLRKVHLDTAAAEAAARDLRRSMPKSAAVRSGRRLPLGPVAVALAGVVIVVAIAVFAASLPSAPAYTSSTPVTDMCIEHAQLVRHDHVQLTITIQGSSYPIPANVGIAPTCMRPLHTHDATGEIHIESPVQHAFTLGDFFTVWGKPFSPSNVVGYSTDGGHTITMTVNGTTSTAYQNLVLVNGQQIAITLN